MILIRDRKKASRLAEGSLLLASVLLLGLGAVPLTQSMLAQREAQNLLQSLPSPQTDGSQPRTPGQVEGSLHIPSIGLSVPILTGCTTATLQRGACRLMGTAIAGGLGNMALAGHRDTRFRLLEHLGTGAIATITDNTGTYDYQVDGVEIVTPEQVSVLEIHDRPELTLITCFPFHYVGPAPQRYIVHAHLLPLRGSAS